MSGSGPISGNNLQFSCGNCAVATFADAVSVIGAGLPLCGYSSQVPRNILDNDDQLCARSVSTGRRFPLDLLSHRSGSGCYDADGGASCAASGGYTSYTRGDGFGDACDACPGSGTTDVDGDSLCEGDDNCDDVANPGQEDTDDDGVGDACNDASDADGDEWEDEVDNCPDVANPGQEDTDHDGTGNSCNDADDADGDEWDDSADNCPSVANPTQQNTCYASPAGDACDSDSDGDGRWDACDNCPSVANAGQEDINGNSFGDICEPQGKLDTAGCYSASDTIAAPDGSEPTYSYVDISSSGTVIPIGSHTVSSAIPLGFSFSYYGTSYSQLYVSSNGFLSFRVNQGEGCCGGYGIPQAGAPNALITGLWAHLHPNTANVYYKTQGTAPAREFILQFKNVVNYDTGSPENWEIVLSETSNQILVRYANANSAGATTTGGIENETGTIGLRWAGPGRVALVNEAVRYTPTANLSADGDGDGKLNCLDNCSAVANAGQQDSCPASAAGDACDIDADSDGLFDACDNCPNAANPGQEDSDYDGVGDACNDSVDADGDEWSDTRDNCPSAANAGQEDTDYDGVGDACNDSVDPDGDERSNTRDNCPNAANPGQEDTDSDGVGDACNDSIDGDGDEWNATTDNCPPISNPDQEDTNLDGIGDACDPVVEIQGMTEDGGTALETTAVASSPVGAALSGRIYIQDGAGAVSSLTFYWLSTTCGADAVFKLTINGVTAATIDPDAGNSCTCDPPAIQTASVPLSSVIPLLRAGGNQFGVTKTGGSTGLAWAYATITIGGAPIDVEIFDQGGGDSYGNPSLCGSGYTFGDVSVRAAGPGVAAPRVSQSWSGQLPCGVDMAALGAGSYALVITARDASSGVWAYDNAAFSSTTETVLGINGGASCNDGNACTTSDTCIAGTCTGGPAPVCTDSNVCNGLETCDPSLGCRPGTSLVCSNNDVCDGLETCDPTLGCQDGASLECDDEDGCTNDSCDPLAGCASVEAPATTCMDAGTTQLLVKDNAVDAKDKILWKWAGGPAVLQPNLGSPDVSTVYTLCIYDSTANADSLVARLRIDPNANWEDRTPKGWLYKDRDGLFGGAVKAQLRTGADGRSAASLAAKGELTPMPMPLSATEFFDLDPGVTVQLVNDATSVCWTSRFLEPTRNTGTMFKAKAKAQ
jgi:hypothetical protein